MKKFKNWFIVFVLLCSAVFFIGCKQTVDEDSNTNTTPYIEMLASVNGKTINYSQFLSEKGIPWTITNTAVKAGVNLEFNTRSYSGDSKDAKVIAKVLTPENNPPVIITPVPGEKDSFKLELKEVNKATDVTISFSLTADSKVLAEEKISFQVLPEPKVDSLELEEKTINLLLQEKKDIKLEVNYNPQKYGSISASDLVRPKNKTLSIDVKPNDILAATNEKDGILSIETKKAGTAKITVKAQNNKTVSFDVNVSNIVKPQQLNLLKNVNMLKNSEKTIKITAIPTGASLEISEWKNSNPKIASIEAGTNSGEYKIKTKNKNGTTKFTAKSKHNPDIELVINLRVSNSVLEKITITPDTVKIGTGGIKKLEVTKTPSLQYYDELTNKLVWSSLNEDIVSVDKNGKIKALKEGKAIIEVKSNINDEAKDSVEVTVVKGITEITGITATASDSNNTLLYKGHDIDLKANINPSDAWGDLHWSPNYGSIKITVDPNDQTKAKLSVTKWLTENQEIDVAVKTGYEVAGKYLDECLSKEIKINVIRVPDLINIRSKNDDNAELESKGKMYCDESVELYIKAFNFDEDGYPAHANNNNEVVWTVGNADANITEEGILTYSGEAPTDGNFKTITVTATSKWDSSINSTQKIKVYQPKLEISSMSASGENELIIGENYRLGIRTISNPKAYNKVVVCYFREHYEDYKPATDWFEETEITNPDYNSSLTAKDHTLGKAKTFYVFPIDPKTGKAYTNDKTFNFELSIWQETTGIMLTKDGEECNTNSSGKYVLSMDEKTNSTGWKVVVAPEYAKPCTFKKKVTGETNWTGKDYVNIKNWVELPEGGNTFSISTIGVGSGSATQTVTFTSIEFPEIKGTLSVTVYN